VVKGDRANSAEFVKVIFVRSIISVPSYYVKRTVFLLIDPTCTVEADKYFPIICSVLISCLRSNKVSVIS